MKNQSIPKTGMAGLKAHFKDDLIAGLVVSLIALPLCLGIASASGVPPLAGVVTAIIGGILASRFSGTFVTISGPAAGLIVITLGAVESMGSPGSFEGYPHALGAIVVGGLIMAIFGFLKVGKVGDFFPSAAVHGMLAAIGVIIMIKLLFPALGVAKPNGEILEVATEIPHALTHFNKYALIISLVTLATLILHPFIKSKMIKMIPAPMWVLIFTIPLAAILGTDNLSMVDLDGGLLSGGGLQFPSFEKIATSAFWIAVVGFALVSAIESLLSAKAVDSLDPYKRKSDLDKDLISMGAGSSIAAFAGGLPMISEIVRSSANVNNGAKTQWSNFIHGVFLLIYVLIGVYVIEMIPNAALAAMLVFTGFKLASPKEFKHMYKVGMMELEIFLVTLFAVLATDLIIGIVIGILFKYVLVLFKGTKINELFKSKLTMENDGKTKIIHLKGSQIFSNYLSLKKKMDSGIEKFDEVLLDFTDVNFVDHTVIEHLEEYERNAKLIGKEVHVRNIEDLHPLSNHPLSARDRKSKAPIKTIQLSARGKKLNNYAIERAYSFVAEDLDYDNWDFYSITTRKKIVSIQHVFAKKSEGIEYTIADIETKKGAETSTDYDTLTGIKISGLPSSPEFYMVEETLFDRLSDILKEEDINFEDHQKFSLNCVLKGVNKEATESFFTDSIICFFEDNLDLFLISNGKELFLRSKYAVLSTDEISNLQEKAIELVKVLS
ncbi:MAG: SulP family inorganic anion transporter [Fluviicola sp.]|nr:SulP family inorganic anion transporter [Fluviicola sp.]